MKVIWKRPDGFLNAQPSDFKVVDLDGHFKIWLHKSDHTWFPFRVSGDWKEEESTKLLNLWINLLDQDDDQWHQSLKKQFGHSKVEDPNTFVRDTFQWLNHLQLHLKGDTWELEIMNKTMDCIQNRLKSIESKFLNNMT